MKVKELIEKLKKCNQKAELTVGNNFDNGISISYGYSDGCIDNDESFSKTMIKYAKRAANEPEFFKYFLKLQRFQHEHCEKCDSQLCLGVYDEDWREGCELFKKEFKDVVFL